MSISLYTQIKAEVTRYVDVQVDASSRERLALLVTGIIGSQGVSPARIARALKQLGVSGASVESLERQVRRIENDPELTAALCVHPLARHRLRMGQPAQLLLAIDPTSQDDRVALLTVSVIYRGRSAPLGGERRGQATNRWRGRASGSAWARCWTKWRRCCRLGCRSSCWATAPLAARSSPTW